MNGMKTRQQNKSEPSKYQRITTALTGCGFTVKYKAKFLRHKMDDNRCQKYIENLKDMELFQSSIIPNAEHRKAFITEFKKAKLGEDDKAGDQQQQVASSSQSIKTTLDAGVSQSKTSIADSRPGPSSSSSLSASSNREWIFPTGNFQIVPLNLLTESESLEFVVKELKIPDLEFAEFQKASKEFIELIGGLPLALQQAVAFITQENKLKAFVGIPYKISDYVKEFKSNMEKFLPFPLDLSPTVFATSNVTLEKIQKLVHGKEAVKILEILSFLYDDKIPFTFLHDLVPEIEDAEFSGALLLLEKYSLIKVNVKEFSLNIHRQLQIVILQYLKKSNDVSKVVMNLVNKCIRVLENINLSKSSDISLNLHQTVKSPFDLSRESEKLLLCMSECGGLLSEVGRYSESLDVYMKGHSESQELLGKNHENTLELQHQIALQLDYLGRYEEALSLYKENLEKSEIHLGVDHSDTLTTKYNIARVLREQEKFQESLELFGQVLTQRNNILGENHPLTLSAQHQIASLHADVENFSTAFDLLERVEKKQIEVLGPHHREVLTTKHNKATVLFRMDKFQEASKIFNEVHEKKKETLGENHLNTILTLEWIAETLKEEGKSKKALETYKKVYESRRMELGEDHSQTVATKENMANVLRRQKNYQESLELFGQVLTQRNNILGENHPSTLKTQNEIASLHSDLGNFSKAFDLYQELEMKQIEILGPDHRDVLITKYSTAIVLFNMDKFQEASKIFNEVYEKQKEKLGENHLNTIQNLEQIAAILEKHGKHKEAFDLAIKVYEIRKARLGEDHSQTIMAKSGVDYIGRNLWTLIVL